MEKNCLSSALPHKNWQVRLHNIMSAVPSSIRNVYGYSVAMTASCSCLLIKVNIIISSSPVLFPWTSLSWNIRMRMNTLIISQSRCTVIMAWQFSDRGLGSTKPAIYGNKWLHVIMTYIIACIVNGYGMCVTAWFKRIVSICSIAITTTRHASVTFIRPAKLKWVHMSTSCTNTCIMCMRWKFSDRGQAVRSQKYTAKYGCRLLWALLLPVSAIVMVWEWLPALLV